MSKISVAIIGGGISALSAARHLRDNSIAFRLFEKANRVGGVIGSEWKDGYLVEYGPNSFSYKGLLNPQYLESLNLRPLSADETLGKNRYVIKNGIVKSLPMSPKAFLKTDILSFLGKLRMFREPFVPVRNQNNDEDESIASFIERRFGREMLDYMINPFIAGVYAGNPNALSTRLCFPDLVRWEQESKSVMRGALKQAQQPKKDKPPYGIFSFEDGMQTLIDAMEKGLEQNLSLGCNVESINKAENGEWCISGTTSHGEKFEQKADSVIFTAPQHTFPRLMMGANDVPTAEYPPLAVMLLGFQKTQIAHKLDGFGMLSPQVENRTILGCIFSSSIFPNRAPEGYSMLTCFIGGSRNPELATLEESALKEIVLGELRALLGVSGDPVFVHTNRWTQSIPQYHLTYSKILDKMDNVAKENPGLFFAGNYYKGVAVGDAFTSGIVAAQNVGRFLTRV